MPPLSHTTLRQRISAELARILGSYVALIVMLVAAIAIGGAIGFTRMDLGHHRELVRTRLVTEMSNVGHEMTSLATSSLLWTGLTDSYGRETYLAPLIARLNRSELRRYVLLDYRGRVFMATDESQAQALAADATVVAAVRAGREGHGIRADARGLPELVLVQRVMSPQSESPVGFIVGVVRVGNMIDQIDWRMGMRVSVTVGDQPPVPALPAGWNLTVTEVQRVVVGDASIPLRFWVAQPVLPVAAAIALVVAVAVAAGLAMLRRVRHWAYRFSGTLTARLDKLLVDCQRLLAGENVTQLDDTVDDELSEVTRALAVMLRIQRKATDEMRTTALVFSTAAEGILVTDPNGGIVDANPALCAMTGFSRNELVGRRAGSLYRSAGRGDQRREMVDALIARGRWSGETHFLDRNGRIIPTSVSISSIRDEAGESLGNVAVITDVSKLKEAENKLRDLAFRDALTGLPNFRLLSRQVREMLNGLPVVTGRLAVLFIDVDQLKYVNDTYGHETGDALIKSVASRLQQVLPPGHLLCRRSGDEFIAVVDITLPGSEDRLREALSRLNPVQVPVGNDSIPASATVGVSRLPEDATNWQELQICADVAMNEGKQARRGSVLWYGARLGRKMYRQRQIQRRLAQAIEQQAIHVHYQPEVDLETGRVIGFEALARWTDPELGEVPPTEFIAVAEDAHLIEPLTLLVAQTVLRDKPLLQARFAGAVVAFNVAPKVLRNPRLIKLLASRAAQDGVIEGLEVELTESEVDLDEGGLLPQLQALTGLGVLLAIDDFGTGHSSLSRLAQLPISRLKIDRSFVMDLHQERQAKIARLIVNLARGLGFEVTAEGVEAPEQAAALLEMGCRRGQGWLYARALPLEEALALVEPLQPAAVAAEA